VVIGEVNELTVHVPHPARTLADRTSFNQSLKKFLALSAAGLTALSAAFAQQKTVTIAAVNNPDMIRLKKLSSKFEEQNPDIKLNWVVLEENVLRQKVTTDVSQASGQFDLVYLGLYEAPIFAKRGWLRPIENVPADYDIEDVFKSIRDGLSDGGKLYAIPFNAESSMLMYRKDLFEAKGLTMPEQLFLAPALEQPLRAGCSGSDRDPATEQPADSAVANSH
jgi:sorbitol/mannitol transport system substrate-binding protein